MGKTMVKIDELTLVCFDELDQEGDTEPNKPKKKQTIF